MITNLETYQFSKPLENHVNLLLKVENNNYLMLFVVVHNRQKITASKVLYCSLASSKLPAQIEVLYKQAETANAKHSNDTYIRGKSMNHWFEDVTV